jgi:hypothetical protein
MTHGDQRPKVPPCPGGVPAGGCILHRGGSDRQQMLRVRGADTPRDGLAFGGLAVQ